MAGVVPVDELALRARLRAAGWDVTYVRPHNLILEGRDPDVTMVAARRGDQVGRLWLYPDDAAVDGIVRPLAGHRPARRQVDGVTLWCHVLDGERAGAELVALAPRVPDGLDACVASLRARGWQIDRIIDDRWDCAWTIDATTATHALHVELGAPRAGDAPTPTTDAGGWTTLSTATGGALALVYAGPLADELLAAVLAAPPR